MSTATLVSPFHTDYRDIYKGLQSHRITTDLRQQMSLTLERQFNGQLNYAPLLNLPLPSQGSTLPTLSSISNFAAAVKTASKQHPPLTASNSVANCNAASHLKVMTATREHRKLDRSVSEPVTQHMQKPVMSNSSRYKTELCRTFEENGECKYGDKCQFAHGENDLRPSARHPKYKTEPCRTFHSTGLCPYGPRCHFIHNTEDSKQCIVNSLQNSRNIPVNRISPPPESDDYDICGFSIGSAGDLSPTGSSNSSNGSPPSSLHSFFMGENQASTSVPQVPQTAPPNLSGGMFFCSEYLPLKSLSPLQSLARHEDFLSQNELTENVISTLEMLDINSLAPSSNANLLSTKPEASAAIDINQNDRLPVFHSLAVGNSP